MRSKVRWVPWAVALAVWLLPAAEAIGQPATARVVDANGNPVPNARFFSLVSQIKFQEGTTDSQGEVPVTSAIPDGTPYRTYVRWCYDEEIDDYYPEYVDIVVEGREHEQEEDDDDCYCEEVGGGIWDSDGVNVVDIGAPAGVAASPGADGGLSWYIVGKYEFRHFYKWEDVSGDDPSVATHDATSSSHGAGLYVGARLGDLPLWGMVGGYYAGGLETNTTLDNGHRIRGEVDQYALGGGLRLLLNTRDVFNPYFWAAALYTWNKGDFTDSNAVAESDHRVLKSWTGEYGVGGTWWVAPRVGLDFGVSYNGQFSGDNADENVRGSVGMIINGGAVCGGQCGGRR